MKKILLTTLILILIISLNFITGRTQNPEGNRYWVNTWTADSLEKINEIVTLRQENTKTFNLTNGKQLLEAHIGAIHYKDNYADLNEQWKDIDLTWKGNKITKAPYELTLEGQKITIRDKKTGEVSTCELLSSKPTDLNWEIIPKNDKVAFRHILSFDKIPFKAKFKITGKIPFVSKASDDEGEIELETTFVDGILTEKLSQIKDKQTGKIRSSKGNIRIDPTWSVGVGSDDCLFTWYMTDWYFSTTYEFQGVGWLNEDQNKTGTGMRFTSINIPQGSTINNAHLTLIARQDDSVTIVNSKITGNDVDNAATWSTETDYRNRRGTIVGGANNNYITSAQVNWDSIPAWTEGNSYNSPEIKIVIQEIINRGGWESGNCTEESVRTF